MAYNKALPAAMPMKAKALPPAPKLAQARPLPANPQPTRTVYSNPGTYKSSQPTYSNPTNTYVQTGATSPSARTTNYNNSSSSSRISGPSCNCCRLCVCPSLSGNDNNGYKPPRSFGHLDGEAKAFMFWLLNDKLDVYCVMAFYMRTSQWRKIPMALWKVVCVGGLQSFGLYLLYTQAVDVTQGCGVNQLFTGIKWLAFLFGLYITVDNSTKIRNFNRWCMYMYGKQQPPWLNKFWVAIGFAINVFVLFLSWFVSCFLIISAATTGDPLEVTLNALAITFIIEMDTQIITETDYDAAEEWFSENYGSFNSGITGRCVDGCGEAILSLLGIWEKPCPIVCNTGRIGGACNGGMCQRTILEWILLPFQIIAPFIVLICS